MRKAVLICLVFGVVFVCHGRPLEEVLRTGEIRVLVPEIDLPPFIMTEGRSLIGFDVDVVRLLSRDLGVKVSFVRKGKTLSDVVDGVNKGVADIGIGRLIRVPKEARKVFYSDPYAILHTTILANRLKTSKFHTNPLEFIKKFRASIGVFYVNPKVSMLKREFGGVKIYRSWDRMVEDVLKGRIYALVSDDLTVEYYIKKHRELFLYLLPYRLKERPNPISIVTSWENLGLLRWINTFIRIRQLEGTFKKLKRSYVNEP